MQWSSTNKTNYSTSILTFSVANAGDYVIEYLVSSEYNKDIATVLASEFPMYRTMVVRRFDNRKDKFVYSIYFRSSYSMITYINSLKEEGSFNSSDAKNAPEEEIPAE